MFSRDGGEPEAVEPGPEFAELEAEFGEVISLLRGGLLESPVERPSEAVWDGIIGELGPSVSGQAAPSEVRTPDVSPEPLEAGGGAVVRDISSARSWSRPLAMLTGAAAVLLVGIPLFLSTRGGDDDPALRAELAALDGFDGAGQAELSGRDLSVSFDGSEAPDGAFYEVWLLDFEGDDLEDTLWIGRFDVTADGSFAVPEDVDIADYDIVDVSIEPDDGNPEHSGDSVLRGGLIDL